jgi:hypothetical protein
MTVQDTGNSFSKLKRPGNNRTTYAAALPRDRPGGEAPPDTNITLILIVLTFSLLLEHNHVALIWLRFALCLLTDDSHNFSGIILVQKLIEGQEK